MPETLKLNPKDRYLEKMNDGRILPWTKRLAMRNDMREFEPEFDKDGSLIKRKQTVERMAELEAENARLQAMIAERNAMGDPATVGLTSDDMPEEDGEPIILDELEEEFIVAPKQKVTREFLETREPAELRDYALKVYNEKLHPLKKQETLVDDILELQKKAEIEIQDDI